MESRCCDDDGVVRTVLDVARDSAQRPRRRSSAHGALDGRRRRSVSRSDCRAMRSRRLLRRSPGSAAIASSVASRTPCKLPKAASNCRRFDSPTPGMRSSSDVIVRTARRLRWKVIAKRCASSRACCSTRSAGDRRGSRSGSLRPSTKISSSRFARLIIGIAPRPSASSAACAALSCPLPPSITTRSGNGFSSSMRRVK